MIGVHGWPRWPSPGTSFQHFYPYFDVVKTEWPGELRSALTKAATDPDEQAFLETLRRLVAALQDGTQRI